MLSNKNTTWIDLTLPVYNGSPVSYTHLDVYKRQANTSQMDFVPAKIKAGMAPTMGPR